MPWVGILDLAWVSISIHDVADTYRYLACVQVSTRSHNKYILTTAVRVVYTAGWTCHALPQQHHYIPVSPSLPADPLLLFQPLHVCVTDLQALVEASTWYRYILALGFWVVFAARCLVRVDPSVITTEDTHHIRTTTTLMLMGWRAEDFPQL